MFNDLIIQNFGLNTIQLIALLLLPFDTKIGKILNNLILVRTTLTVVHSYYLNTSR